MKQTLIVIAAFLLLGCQPSLEQQARMRPDNQPKYIKGTSVHKSDSLPSIGYEVYYFQDTRTGVCFAERGEHRTYSFATVDCEKVKDYIK